MSNPFDTGILKITDGTDYVNIRDGVLYLSDWKPAIVAPKGGGVWRQSPLTSGRQLVIREWDNIIETINLSGKGTDMAAIIDEIQKLRQLLSKAQDYWVSQWANEPVWIEARSPREANTRYAIIYDWRNPQDDNPYVSDFFDQAVVSNEFQLIIEHGLWQDAAPGSGNCINIAAYDSYCYPFQLEFDGFDDYVNFGSNAALDDIPTGDFTVDGWFYFDGSLPLGGAILDKYNCFRLGYSCLGYGNANVLTGYLDYFDGFVNVPAIIESTINPLTLGQWHHIAFVFDIGTDSFLAVYVDGVDVTDAGTIQAGLGAYVSDAAGDLIFGKDSLADNDYWNGGQGWIRISNNQRWLAAFPGAVPAQCTIPAVDGNTILLSFIDGKGTVAQNRVGTAGTDGLILGPQWISSCCS